MNPQGLVNGGKNPFPPVSEEATRKLIEQLCIDIKFARDIKDCKQSAGGNNNIIKFSCLPLSAKDNHQRIYCVLRTCKTTYFNTNPPSDTDIKSQVAFTQEFREKHGLPIPYTEAWDSTYQNCIGCPYVIMERAAGKTLEYELFKLSLDLQSPRDANMERRCNYARCVAAFLASIDKIKLAGYGTLKAGPEMAVRGTTVNASFELSRDTIDGHRIPWQPDFSKWIENLLRVQFLRTTGNDFDDVSADEKWRIQKLCQVGGEMKQAGLLTDQPAVLWHWDFFPRNIMVKNMGNDAKITAVIDWDEARAVGFNSTSRSFLAFSFGNS